jgi:hypothetical protein
MTLSALGAVVVQGVAAAAAAARGAAALKPVLVKVGEGGGMVGVGVAVGGGLVGVIQGLVWASGKLAAKLGPSEINITAINAKIPTVIASSIPVNQRQTGAFRLVGRTRRVPYITIPSQLWCFQAYLLNFTTQILILVSRRQLPI